MEKMNGQLEKFRDIHHGERAFIVGSAPSILNLDLSKLDGDILFGSNRIYLYYPALPAVKYYSIGDRSCLSKISNDRQAGCRVDDVGTVFCRSAGFDNVIDDLGWIADHPEAVPYVIDGEICDRGFCLEQPRHGWSITHESIWLALWMGCDPLYVIGVDCQYPPGSVGERCFNRDKAVISHRKIREWCDKNGRRIFNAGFKGSLDVYERVYFNSIFGGH